MPGANRIEHLIVLMLENRSFDHVLGFLPGPGGLTGAESNPAPAGCGTAGSQDVSVTPNAPFVSVVEPPHDWKYPGNFRHFAEFLADAASGHLPAYAFIEPRYFGLPGAPANDCHPPHDMRFGEQLVAQVYNAVMQGPASENCLLVVLFDEHGGYYDHVTPPAATRPDDFTSTTPEFDFSRLGLRVPAILISPYVKPGRDATLYEHASIPATVKKLFGLQDFLTARDAAANTFESVIDFSTPPIPPVTLPPSPVTMPSILAALFRLFRGPAGLSDEQQGLVALAGMLAAKPQPAAVSPISLIKDLNPNGPCAAPTPSLQAAAVAPPTAPAGAGRPAVPGHPIVDPKMVDPNMKEDAAGKYVQDMATEFLR
jgi:phospholipase C